MDEADKVQPLSPGAMAERIAALERRNAELEAIVAELRAELERLKRRRQRQAAPFRKDQRVTQPKRPGRKAGQGRFAHRSAPSEALSEPPIVVPVTEMACSHCGGALVADEPEAASLTDLPEQPRPVVRQYAVGVSHCQACGRRVRGRHPDLAADQYGATAHRLGPRLLATAQSPALSARCADAAGAGHPRGADRRARDPERAEPRCAAPSRWAGGGGVPGAATGHGPRPSACIPMTPAGASGGGRPS